MKELQKYFPDYDGHAWWTDDGIYGVMESSSSGDVRMVDMHGFPSNKSAPADVLAQLIDITDIDGAWSWLNN